MLSLLCFKVNAPKVFCELELQVLRQEILACSLAFNPGLNVTVFRGTGSRKKEKTRPRIARLPLSMTKYVFFFSLFYSEYIKVMDGSGATVLIRYGYSSTPQKPFREVNFGNSDNITVQVYLYGSYSNVRLQFGIVQQGLQSG